MKKKIYINKQKIHFEFIFSLFILNYNILIAIEK